MRTTRSINSSSFTTNRGTTAKWLGLELLALLGALVAVGCSGADEQGAEQIGADTEKALVVCKPPNKLICGSPSGCSCVPATPPTGPFYDTSTQCTVGGATMHCCPSGSAMVGARVDMGTLKCDWLRDASGVVSLDTGTQRNNMHACTSGWVMIGMDVPSNLLACKQIPTGITSERVDTGTQDAFPMHVCESTATTQAMSGIRVDQNLFTCASNANFR
jgi:hypothetical protein